MATTKTNFLFNFCLTISNYLFSLITYPYVSRVLGVQNIGICNYVDGIINYFVLFSALGIGIFGTAEIARRSGDAAKTGEVFSSLLTANVVLTLISTLILIAATAFIPHLQPYRPFLLIGISKLVFSALSVEWLFKGLSDFKYITIRSLAVKSLYAVSVFCFVRTANDTMIYYGLVCFAVVANAMVNLRYSRHFVNFSLRTVRIMPYIAPIAGYGLYMILTSMYTGFNVVYLGSVADDTQVGYFTTATKLHGILLGCFTALTTVLMPKISYLVSKGDKDHIKNIASKSFDAIFMVSLPLMIMSLFYAPLIIGIIAGGGYEGAIVPFRIAMMLLLVIGIEQIVIIQFIIPSNNSRCVLTLSLAGAVVGVFLNVLLVPTLQAVGSVLSWTASECTILLLSLHYFKKYFAMTFPLKRFIGALLASFPYVAIGYFTCSERLSSSVILGLAGMAVWFVIDNLYISRRYVFIDLYSSVSSRLINLGKRR